jgi:CBS domain-containing protein
VRKETIVLLKEILAPNFKMVRVDSTIQKAAELMKAYNNQNAVVVGRSGECVGLLTSKEMVGEAVAGGIDPTIGRVVDIMSTEVVRCYDDEDLGRAAEIMQTSGVSALVVVDKTERPAGVVSFSDLLMGAVFLGALGMQRESVAGPPKVN